MNGAERRGTSLRLRLAALVTGLCVFLTLSIGVGLWQVVRRASVDALDRELATSAEVLGQLVHLDRDGSIEVEDHGGEELAIAHRIETLDGRVVSEGGLSWGDAGRLEVGTEAIVVDGHPWRVLGRPIHLERNGLEATLILRVATSARPMVALRETASRAILVATAAAALLGALAAAIVARATTAPLRDLTRRVSSLGAASLDATIPSSGSDREVLSLTAAFNGLLHRLREAFARQRSFVARASHALRTPTANILTRAEVTLARSRTEEEYRTALAEIADSARESAALVDHLLHLARLDERETELHPGPIALEAIAVELERSLAPRARASEVSLSFAIEPGATLVADRSAIRELLEVLLDNALRYTPAGGSAGLRASGSELVVWDTGKGMTAADKAQAFDRFFRGSAADETGASGSGLGLAIARSVAERHDASIELRDRKGGGLEVVTRWPGGSSASVAARQALGT